MKKPLLRVTFPPAMVTKVRQLAPFKHLSPSAFMRQAVQKEIDLVDQQKRRYEARQRRDDEL